MECKVEKIFCIILAPRPRVYRNCSVAEATPPAMLFWWTNTSAEFSVIISKKDGGRLPVRMVLVSRPTVTITTHFLENIWCYFSCGSKYVWTCLQVESWWWSSSCCSCHQLSLTHYPQPTSRVVSLARADAIKFFSSKS